MATSSLYGALSFLGIMVSNSEDSFSATLSPTITPPRGIPNVMILSPFSLSSLVIFLIASPKIFPAADLFLSLS
jgi:hypothetical protein